MNGALLLAATLAAPLAAGADPAGVYFMKDDWEIACDNTRTCRAAGYYAEEYTGDEDAPLKVTVLLTRKAGPGQEVTGELTLGSYGPDDDKFFAQFKTALRLTMFIDERKLGTVQVDHQSLTATLSPAQARALAAALPGKSTIAWRLGGHTWRLSDRGAAAVLLKMDEFQGRLGTRGALLRRGQKDEATVLAAVPPPVVRAAAPMAARPGDAKLFAAKSAALRKHLLDRAKPGDCDGLAEPEEELTIERLSEGKLLVGVRCVMGAYQSSSAFWIVDQAMSAAPVLATDSAQEYSDGVLSGSFKGRGLGDCWSSDEWTWDGQRFVHTASSSTGMCRLINAGGPWSLPTIVTTVRPARAP